MFLHLSVCSQGVGILSLDRDPLDKDPWTETPPMLTSSGSRYSGRYASYWNAFLFY